MDEVMVRKRVTEILQKVYGRDTAFVPTTAELVIYRTAYAAGLDAAAKIANEERVDYESTGEESDRVYNQACADIEESLRQARKEMGHE